MEQNELNKILENHRLWLADEGGVRADLRWANLGWANLAKVDIINAVGNMREIKSLQVDTYFVAYTSEVMAIGCEQHTLAEWWAFTDEEIHKMDGQRGLDWWRKWRPILMQIMEVGGT